MEGTKEAEARQYKFLDAMRDSDDEFIGSQYN